MCVCYMLMNAAIQAPELLRRMLKNQSTEIIRDFENDQSAALQLRCFLVRSS